MKEMENEILQGSTDGHFFSHDLGKLSNKTYEMAGRLTSFSILHGGQGFPVFNMALYYFLTNREPNSLPDIESCVIDLDIRERLLKVVTLLYFGCFRPSMYSTFCLNDLIFDFCFRSPEISIRNLFMLCSFHQHLPKIDIYTHEGTKHKMAFHLGAT